MPGRAWTASEQALLVKLRQVERLPIEEVATHFPHRTVSTIRNRLSLIGAYRLNERFDTKPFLGALSSREHYPADYDARALQHAREHLKREIAAAKAEAPSLAARGVLYRMRD